MISIVVVVGRSFPISTPQIVLYVDVGTASRDGSLIKLNFWQQFKKLLSIVVIFVKVLKSTASNLTHWLKKFTPIVVTSVNGETSNVFKEVQFARKFCWISVRAAKALISIDSNDVHWDKKASPTLLIKLFVGK